MWAATVIRFDLIFDAGVRLWRLTVIDVKKALAKARRNGTLDEYLRRNLLHASSVGALANAEAALERVRRWKSQPKWLVELLKGIIERAGRVEPEMAAHRDELDPYRV